MSKYQFTESNIYLPGSDIPKNNLGIETPDLLHEVEATLLQQASILCVQHADSSRLRQIAADCGRLSCKGCNKQVWIKTIRS